MGHISLYRFSTLTYTLQALGCWHAAPARSVPRALTGQGGPGLSREHRTQPDSEQKCPEISSRLLSPDYLLMCPLAGRDRSLTGLRSVGTFHSPPNASRLDLSALGRCLARSLHFILTVTLSCSSKQQFTVTLQSYFGKGRGQWKERPSRG